MKLAVLLEDAELRKVALGAQQDLTAQGWDDVELEPSRTRTNLGVEVDSVKLTCTAHRSWAEPKVYELQIFRNDVPSPGFEYLARDSSSGGASKLSVEIELAGHELRSVRNGHC